MKARTWTTGCEAADQAGFIIIHCGHPTANYPYYMQTPPGSPYPMGIAPNNMAFQYLADCQAAARLLHRGELVMAGPLNRCCLVPGAPPDHELPSDTQWLARNRTPMPDHAAEAQKVWQLCIHRTWAVIRHERLTRAQRRKAGVR